MAKKVPQSKPYTARQAVAALGREIRDRSSGLVGRAARATSGRGRQVDQAVDDVQERDIVRR